MTNEERKSRKRKNRRIALAVIAALLLVIVGLVKWFWPTSQDISESEIFNEADVAQQTQYIIALLNEEDYTAFDECTTGDMSVSFTPASIAQAKAKLCEDFGTFMSFGALSMDEMRQRGDKYAFAQQEAVYENVTVTYSLTFDEDMKLVGLYIH